ncbi:MAG TPA: Ig-like domain-containing protein, partial [Thermoanaerobaculaceae bacterium]|nr:Ig-like domain-containing protein [Thermoanaerobaculaceae bacterium]
MSFTVAADESAPSIEGLVARRADGEAATRFLIGQQLQMEMRVREVETATSTVAVAFSGHLGPVVATLVPGTVNLYRTPMIAVPEVAGEVSIGATATAIDFGGNAGTATTTFSIAPTSDPYDPVVKWLTPWEGAPWPAAYTSVVTSQPGSWLLVRVKVTDLDLSGTEVVPGTIASVYLRGPVLDAGTIALAPEWSPASRLPVDGEPSDIWELPWLVPNGVPALTSLPFEVRVSDVGANVVTRTVRMQAVPFRKVYEGTLTAVLPGDPMVGAGGVDGGGVFLLDGATVSLYPQGNTTVRGLPSLHLYSGGQGSSDSVVVHPSVLTVPEVTSPSSPILYYPLELQIDESLGVGHGARIETTARGLLGAVPTQPITLPGVVPAQLGAGGSHGGKGWFGSPGGWQRADLWEAGSVYDSLRDPHLPGGAGGWQDAGPVAGGTGGGVIRILAGGASVYVAGELAANGSEGPATALGTGGGAGGSVCLVAGRVEGPGRILAEGGRGHYYHATGGGGGGRVAITYRELGADFDPARSVSATGGRNENEGSGSGSYLGGAGTVFWQALDAAAGLPVGSGNLLVANATGLPAALTPLPSLGEGEVLGVDVGARTLTLSSPAIAGEMIGESVVVKVAGEADRVWTISSHEPVESGGIPATRLAVVAGDAELQNVASALAGAQTVTFVGRSRFSSISVRGAARLVTEDDLEVGDVNPGLNDRTRLDLEEGARVRLRAEQPAASLTAEPAPGSDVAVGGSITIGGSVESSLGLRRLDEQWSPDAVSTTTWPGSQALSVNVGPHILTVPATALPGQARYQLDVTDIGGRSRTQVLSWNVKPNAVPTGLASFAAGSPAAVFPGASVTVTVEAQDAEGLASMALAVTGPATVAAPFQTLSGNSVSQSFVITTTRTALSSETAVLTAIVVDLAGAQVTTNALSLGILPDTLPPVLHVAGVQDSYFAGQTLAAQVLWTDEVGASRVELSFDGASTTLSEPTSPMVFSRTIPADITAPRQTALQVVATDYHGHTSAPVTIPVELRPDLPPNVSIASLVPGPQVLAGTTLHIAVHASDDVGLSRIVMSLTGDGLTPVNQTTLVSGASADAVFDVVLPTTLSAGTSLILQVSAIDGLGHSTPTGQAITILEDTTGPAVEVTLSPAKADDLYTAGEVVTLTATATDNVAVSSISMTIDGTTVISPTSPLVYHWTAPAVSGFTPFVVAVEASDPSGHHTPVSMVISVQPLTNIGAPTVHFDCPTSGAYLPSGYGTLVLQATATDDLGVARLEFYREGEASPFSIVTPPSGTLPSYTAVSS